MAWPKYKEPYKTRENTEKTFFNEQKVKKLN